MRKNSRTTNKEPIVLTTDRPMTAPATGCGGWEPGRLIAYLLLINVLADRHASRGGIAIQVSDGRPQVGLFLKGSSRHLVRNQKLGRLKDVLDIFSQAAQHQPAAGIVHEAAETQERAEADAGHKGYVAEVDNNSLGVALLDRGQKLLANRRALPLVAQLT